MLWVSAMSLDAIPPNAPSILRGTLGNDAPNSAPLSDVKRGYKVAYAKPYGSCVDGEGDRLAVDGQRWLVEDAIEQDVPLARLQLRVQAR